MFNPLSPLLSNERMGFIFCAMGCRFAESEPLAKRIKNLSTKSLHY
jgi:hypothetical protein